MRELLERKPVFWAALISLFLVSFSIPLSLGLKYVGSFGGRSAEPKRDEHDQLFPRALVVNSANVQLKIPHQVSHNPVSGRDFLLISWFKLKRLPASERLILLSKYDGEARNGRGFALALGREKNVVRPLVFWGDTGHPGRWYNFSEVALESKHWLMFALSFHGDRYLGVHIGTRFPDGRTHLQLAGGFDLGEAVIPDAENDLILGSSPSRPLRGLIGPLAVISGAKLQLAFKDILKQALKNPLDIKSGSAEGRSGFVGS